MGKKKWIECYDDTHGLWMRAVGGGRYHFIEYTDMWDACGQEDGLAQHAVDLNEVDLTYVTQKDKEAAARSCGMDLSELTEEALAEVLHAYGTRISLAPSTGGSNRRKLIREAKRLSNELLEDADAYDAAVNRTVNRIGSTALEAARGDFSSAIERGTKEGNAEALLMAKISGHVVEEDGSLKRVKAHFSDEEVRMLLPSDEARADPLAFLAGLMDGKAGARLDPDPEARTELAPAYLEGYEKGFNIGR